MSRTSSSFSTCIPVVHMHIPYIHTHTHARTDAQTDRQTDRQAARQTDRQTDIHTYMYDTHIVSVYCVYIYIHICPQIYILSIDVQSKHIHVDMNYIHPHTLLPGFPKF